MCPQAPHLRQHRSRPRHLLEVLRSHYVMVAQDEDGRARAEVRLVAERSLQSHLTISNSPSRSRGVFSAPGVCIVASLTRKEGGRSAERRSGARRNTRGAYHDAIRQALARRLASHDAGRSPLGAPPWRFWASGPRFRLLRRPPSYNGGQLPSDPCSELLAARS